MKATTVTAIGAGALLAAAALVPASGHAQDTRAPSAALATDPPPPFVSQLLARGAAGEFRIKNPPTGVTLRARQPTDLALVKVTLAPGRSTGWHEHAGPSMVIVNSGTLVMREPAHHRRQGCTTELFEAGEAFAHPADVHDFRNVDTARPVEFYVAYFVPEGASPAAIPADPPNGCRP